MSEQPIVFHGFETLTFRQLDRLNGVPKGTSFRAFKSVRGQLVEGRDFFYLPATQYAEFIHALRKRGDAYTSTPHVVLVCESGYEALQTGRTGSDSAK